MATSSHTPLSLPTVDFSKELKPGSSSWISTQTEVRKALEEFGCFEAYCDQVPLEAHKEMYVALEELFNLPEETKMKNVNEIASLFGYKKINSSSEGMGFHGATAIENFQSFTDLMWPEGHPTFCETTHSYMQRLIKLEQMLKRMVFESFGLEKYCEHSIEATDYLFQVKIYRPQVDETSIDLPRHVDRTFLTILHQNGVNGLQVETRGGEWIQATPSPKSFTVFLGESFRAWSNGRLYGAPHRVKISGSTTRYSLGLFGYSKEMVETPQELVDEEHPLLFQPFHYFKLH